MLSALPACPMRLSVRVIPITAKPARVRMFMPKRMSLAKVRRLSGGERWIRTSGTAAQKPWISAAFRAFGGIGVAPPQETDRHEPQRGGDDRRGSFSCKGLKVR